MSLMETCFLYLLFFILSSSTFASTNVPEFTYEKVLTSERTSHPLVHKMAMDKHGFLWVVDAMTLARYDGYRFDEIAGSLMGNSVIIDKKERVWASGMGHLMMYDMQTGTKRQFTQLLTGQRSLEHRDIYDIAQMVNGELLVASSESLSVLDEATMRFTNYLPISAEQPDAGPIDLTSVYPLDANSVLLGTSVGLYRLHLDALRGREDRTILLQAPLLASVRILSIEQISNGYYAVGTRDGVYVLNEHSGEIQQYGHEADNPHSLSDNVVEAVLKVGPESLWIATKLGLDSLNPYTGDITRLLDDPNLQETMGSKIILDLFKIDNRIFVAASNGLFRFDLKQPGQSNLRIRTMEPDVPEKVVNVWSTHQLSNNERLIGTYGLGLFWLKQNGDIERYTAGDARQGQLSSNNVSVIRTDSRNRTWVGTTNGLNLREPNASVFTELRPSELADEPGIDNIRDIVEDSDGKLWFLSTRGLIQTDGNFKLLDFYNDKTRPRIHYDQWAATLHLYNNLLLVGSDNGLTIIDRRKKQTLRYLPIGSAIRIHEDSLGQLWVLSFDTLYRLDVENLALVAIDKMRQFYPSKISEGAVFYNMAEDHYGQLWLAHTGGVMVFDIQEGAFVKVLNREAGFDSLNLLFGRDSMIVEPGGDILFAEIEGLSRFTPAKVQVGPLEDILISRIGYDGKDKAVDIDGDKGVTAWQGNPLKHVQTFNYPLKTLNFEFATPKARYARQSEYRYRLLGYGDDWTSLREQRRVSFTGLPSGEYQLQAKAIIGGRESNTLSYGFIIASPFWKTPWAIFVYILVAASCISLVVRLRARALHWQVSRLEAKVRERTGELERKNTHINELIVEKETLIENVFHQLRTPIQMLLANIHALKTGDTDINTYAAHQTQSIDSLICLTDRVLGVSSHNSPCWQWIDLSTLFRQMAERYTLLASNKPFSFEHSIHENIWAWSDREMLEDIIDNLLGNSFKYTSQGWVKFELVTSSETLVDRQWYLSIRDTGFGIAAERLQEVTKRHVRGENVGASDGLGIGLAMVKHYVDLLNGQLSINSEINVGTTVSVQFALLKSGTELDDSGKNDTPLDKSQEHAQRQILSIDSTQQHVLLVEDNQQLAAYYQNILKRHYKIDTLNDGESALLWSIANIPDLIVSDVMMREMSGFDLVQQLKTHELTCHIPLILLTAKADANSRLKGYAYGANDYIVKPVQENELTVRVHNQLALVAENRKAWVAQLNPDIMVTRAERKARVQEDKLVHSYIEFIANHYADSTLNTDQIADQLLVTRKQLERKIKQWLETTPNVYLTHFRLSTAARMLTEKRKVTVIYDLCGFSSHAYFSKRFKEHYGCSPSEYRIRTETTGYKTKPFDACET